MKDQQPEEVAGQLFLEGKKQRVENIVTVAWLATAGLLGGQILEASSSTCSASHTLLPSASAAPPPPPPQGSRQCEGVGITEGVQASQSALLHGPEHFLRWGCHSMSSCDGVRPIVVRAGSVHPEGVTNPRTVSCGTKKYLSILFFFFNALRRHALRRHALLAQILASRIRGRPLSPSQSLAYGHQYSLFPTNF